MQIEVWKDIRGYQGKYQVSNLGRVKSLNYHRQKKQMILKQNKIKTKNKNRIYTKCKITLMKDSVAKTYTLSRLVYETFVGIIPDGYQIDHRNNDPTDNRLQNLQCLTASENSKKIYIDNPNYKSNGGRAKIKIICLNDNKIYESIHQAARRLNLYHPNIRKVLKGKYKHTGGYSFKYIDEPTEDKQQQNNIG